MEINLNPTITKIFSILQKNNLNAYLVGGVVRDLLIEQYHKTKISNKDYDIEVFGISLSNLETLLNSNLDCNIQKEGESFSVLKVYTKENEDPIDISIPRTETTTGSNYTDFEITPNPDLTVEQAGIRRDITINAIYYNPITQQIIDPFNGVDDLKNKIIRAVNQKTFVEDPLRVLRVMQFAGRFDFEVEKQTINLCKQMIKNNMLQALSTDRVREEFLKFAYKSNYPAISIEFLRQVDLLKIYMPEITALQSTLQTKEWHPEGNVYNHSLQVINAGADIANREGLSNYERATLMFACLYHDSGKALVTVFDEKDKVYRAHGHAEAGVQLVNNFCKRLNLPSFLTRSLPELVRYHMHLPVLFNNHKNGQDQTKAFNRISAKLNKVGVDIQLLLWLVEADRRGRKPNTISHSAKVPLHGEATAEESTSPRHSGLDPESNHISQAVRQLADVSASYLFEPFPNSFIPEFSDLEKWFNDSLQVIKNTKLSEKELITGEQILQVINQKQGVWVGAVKEFIKDLYLTKQFTKDKSRVELFNADENVQENIIKNVYEFLDSKIDGNLPAMYPNRADGPAMYPNKVRGTWKKVVEDEDYRDKLLEEFILK